MTNQRLVARVPSMTRKGASYDIEQEGERTTCSCPAFSYGKKKGAPCKHLQVYTAALVALARCTQLHGTAGDRLCQPCLISLLARMSMKVRASYKPRPRRVPRA